jgi:2TM domain
MTTEDHDEFEGIDISGPWGGVRLGSGRRRGASGEFDGDAEYRAARRRVRRRLDFYRHVATFAFISTVLILIDWATGGGWWAPWLAAIWGAVIVLQGFSLFVSPNIWGRDAEERMIRRELERRRGRVTVTRPPDPVDPPSVPHQ